jgi:hypothetical protein
VLNRLLIEPGRQLALRLSRRFHALELAREGLFGRLDGRLGNGW